MAMAKRRGKGQHGEPWLRAQTGTYYITSDGKKINLKTSDKAEAYRKLDEMQGHVPENPPVATIIDKFIEWSEQQVKRKLQKPRTLETNARYLVGTWSKEDGRKLTDGFKDFVGDMRVDELRTKDVKEWLEVRYPDVSQNTLAGAVKAVKRVFSWATNSRDELPRPLIETNPISGMKVPQYVPRKAWLSEEQWDRIAAEYSPDDPFSDLLRAVRLTGCRPMEVRTVEARHFKGQTWVFPQGKGGFQRTVWLDEEMIELTKKLIAKYPTGPLFRNQKGNEWEPDSLSRRLVRLKQKMREKPELFPEFTDEDIDKVTLYTGRKSFITDTCNRGVALTTAMHLAGHKSLKMISEMYAAPEQNPTFMRGELEKALGR